MPTYTVHQHRHRFASWAASRAAQRSFTSVPNLQRALERCGVVEIVKESSRWPGSANGFDGLHREWCTGVVECLEKLEVQNVTFGRAAKLIAVYIKAMVVIVQPESLFAKVAHPPIDRTLLQRLARDETWPKSYREIWRSTAWTDLDEQTYYELIGTFRQCDLDKPSFWKLERYWAINDK